MSMLARDNILKVLQNINSYKVISNKYLFLLYWKVVSKTMHICITTAWLLICILLLSILSTLFALGRYWRFPRQYVYHWRWNFYDPADRLSVGWFVCHNLPIWREVSLPSSMLISELLFITYFFFFFLQIIK